ncbi:hypothetical protein ABZ883_04865 [Streptomyces sp. NPDC046977]|uniref:hypothetical protein n=1 Tax=Streptomyces sp. NPDC046977 TaxID=3154703 RepID=UPI0033F0E90B
MAKNKTPAATALRKYVDQHGSDPRDWSPQQRSEFVDLSNAATRERVGLPADQSEGQR